MLARSLVPQISPLALRRLIDEHEETSALL
jgi:hypothetical protein